MSLDQSVRRALRAGMILAVAAAGLAACSRGDKSAAPAAGPPTAVATAAPRSGADMDLVTAIALGTDPPPGVLRFEVKARPVPGKPFDVRLQFTPNDDVDSLHATFETQTGLKFSGPAPVLDVVPVQSGMTPEQTLTLLATSEGFSELHVKVETSSAGGKHTAEYAVPLVVPPAAPKGAS